MLCSTRIKAALSVIAKHLPKGRATFNNIPQIFIEYWPCAWDTATGVRETALLQLRGEGREAKETRLLPSQSRNNEHFPPGRKRGKPHHPEHDFPANISEHFDMSGWRMPSSISASTHQMPVVIPSPDKILPSVLCGAKLPSVENHLFGTTNWPSLDSAFWCDPKTVESQ